MAELTQNYNMSKPAATDEYDIEVFNRNADIADKVLGDHDEKLKKLDGIEDGANRYVHPDSGVAANTYTFVKVDGQGHVTEGANPVMPVAQGGTGAADAQKARSNLGAAPENHADSTATYGTGSDARFGHVKLSDSISSDSGSADGIAATPRAIKELKDEVNSNLSKKLSSQYTITDFDSWKPQDLGLSIGDFTICRCAANASGSPSGESSALVEVSRASTNVFVIKVIWANNIWARRYNAPSDPQWGNWDIILGKIEITDYANFNPTSYLSNNGHSCNVMSNGNVHDQPHGTGTLFVGILHRITSSVYSLALESASATSHRHFTRVYTNSAWGDWVER